MKSGIDESLNLLKELELKLRSQPSKTQYRTEPEEPEPRQKVIKKPWGEKLITAYEESSNALEQQNRKLKKYVNKLLQMNDYLKNQLVRQDTYASKYRNGLNPESDYLRMEIQYLQQVNREKELQIQLYEKKMQRHERHQTQTTINNSETPFKQQKTKTRSTKCLQENKHAPKATLRKQSETDTTKRKFAKVKKLSNCPLCY